MKIYRDLVPPTKYGKGTNIVLDGTELAHAIDAYLYVLGISVQGPRTITITTKDGESGLCGAARIYVDPSGRVVRNGDEVT